MCATSHPPRARRCLVRPPPQAVAAARAGPSAAELAARREQEEIELAIATSLSESDSAAAPTPSSASAAKGAGMMVRGPTPPRARPAADPRRQAKALYDFEASEPNELSFQVGQHVMVFDRSDPNWWSGKTQNGAEG